MEANAESLHLLRHIQQVLADIIPPQYSAKDDAASRHGPSVSPHLARECRDQLAPKLFPARPPPATNNTAQSADHNSHTSRFTYAIIILLWPVGLIAPTLIAAYICLWNVEILRTISNCSLLDR